MWKVVPVIAAGALAALWHTPATGLILFGTLLSVFLVSLFQSTTDTP
ncbi:hypothetical protein [Caenispirillum bisanense]|uniref:Uncharacterized protein n=1 Tax=Caenispirillum bisanense TaxID=414052 RepID=A0A286GX61_9PROT|nr:hypothetical protein [Caenispirillum bisanense]SOE00120.1 hypothetical protein SAMN05421508_11191 [Caenispirillum bisanense]